MIRHLHPTDSVLLIPFRQATGRAQAFALSRALESHDPAFPVVRYVCVALSLRAWQSCWVMTDRGRIGAVVRAGRRSGPSAWEVRDLYLVPDALDRCSDLFEEICVQAGRDGARRVFMRLAAGSDVLPQARAAGFVPWFSETLYRLRAGANASAGGAPLKLRTRLDTDDMPLFRLYCAAVPASYRTYGPATEGEWSDAHERAARDQPEWVVDDDAGGIAAWLSTAETGSGRYVAVRVHPEADVSLEALVQAGVDGAEGKSSVALVPSADTASAAALERTGFTAEREFDVLVRPVAVPVAEARRAVAPVA